MDLFELFRIWLAAKSGTISGAISDMWHNYIEAVFGLRLCETSTDSTWAAVSGLLCQVTTLSQS